MYQGYGISAGLCAVFMWILSMMWPALRSPRMDTGRCLLLGLTCICLQLHETASQPTVCTKNDIVFLLDTSESIVENDPYGKPYHYWYLAKNFTYQVVKSLDIWPDRTRVALVAFHETVIDVTRLDGRNKQDGYTTKEETLQALDNLQHRGGTTNTKAALQYAQDMLTDHARPLAEKIIVVVTDGLTSLRGHTLIDDNIPYFGGGYHVFAVAVSKYIDEEEMQYYTSDPPEKHIIHLDDQEMLEDMIKLATFRICGLPDPKDPGTKCYIDNCDVCYSKSVCARCIKGYYWDAAIRTCTECQMNSDLVFLVDNSGSINQKNKNNYNILKDFVKSVVNELDIGLNETRVAMVRFSHEVSTEFFLTTYTTKGLLKQAISEIPYDAGDTDIYLAIHTMRNEILQKKDGDRPHVRNVAILLTDGKSTRSKGRAVPEARLAHSEEVVFFVVAITKEVDEYELKEIASRPLSEHYYNSTDIGHLRTLKNTLIRHVCVARQTPQGGECTGSNGCSTPRLYYDGAFEADSSSGVASSCGSLMVVLVVCLIYSVHSGP